jgi:transposase
MSSFPHQTWRCHISHQLALPSFQLTATEVTSLLQLIGAHRTPQAMAKRARIVLMVHAHPDWSSKQLAQTLGFNARLIRKWRRRWYETHSLQDAPRSGAPRRFSSHVRAQITALACSLPRSHGVPLARWSRVELARHVVRTPSLPAISASTIGRWLAAEQICPWRYHSWQHIQKPEEFLERARPVLQLYEQATSLLEQGTWVICTDEKTCIQAREAEQAPRPANHQHPIYQSPRYHRRGVLHLMAALSVADGLVYGQCHSRKRFVDFRSFLAHELRNEMRGP